MKHINDFDKFMTDTVNLNQTRIDTLESRSSTIIDFVRAQPALKDHFISAEPQGSWAQKTIIKPCNRAEFDADIRVYLLPIAGWEPQDYIENFYAMFRSSDRYREMAHRKTRCVYLDYAGDFHLDIVPCVQVGNEHFVVNRATNRYEITDAQGYRDWFRQKNDAVGNNSLIKVVRLAKYIRDSKKTFTAKSILLTTLLAGQIRSAESEADFKDLPTSLRTIFSRLNGYLQVNDTMPIVENPALPGREDFNRHWNQEKYEVFREKIGYYTQSINLAFEEVEREESIRKWREVFGNGFSALQSERDAKEALVATKHPVTISSAPPTPWLAHDKSN